MSRLVLPLLILVAFYVWWRRSNPAMSAAIGRYVVPLLVLAIAVVYVRSPIDLIPDFGGAGFLDDLVVLGGAIWWALRRFRGVVDQVDRGEPGDDEDQESADQRTNLSPYEVLGVSRNATQEEIGRAYREQMKLYHPDRVNTLGEELQKVAHRKAVEIQSAYDALRT
jgi:uncharacterized membrane protein YkvA (DUF1232 family)